MSTINIGGEEWDTEGLPAHMLRNTPKMVTVHVTQNRNVVGYDIATPDKGITYRKMQHTESFDVQLHDHAGEPLNMGSRPSWQPGEADGWRPGKPSVDEAANNQSPAWSKARPATFAEMKAASDPSY